MPPPPAACTLDADAQAKAGLYAGMRVELYDLSEDTGRDFDCKLLLPLRIFPQASKGAFSKERSKQSSLAGAVPGYWTNVAMLRENAELVEELYWQLSGNVTSWL